MPHVRALAMLGLLGCSLAGVGCKSVSQGGPGLPQPQITATPDLVGFATTLDAAGSTDPAGRPLSYSWRITGVPVGSTIATASLSAPNAAQTTFEPDVGGAYTVTLRVTAGGDVNEVTRTIEVPTWPVYFADGNISPTGSSLAFSVVRSDGSGARSLSCPFTTDMGGGGEGGPLQAIAISGFATLATYESGDDPLVAFPQLSFIVDSGGRSSTPFSMYVGSSRSDCMTRPASRVDTLAPVVLGAGVSAYYLFTRFSPNGRRIAFVASPQGSGRPQLITVGIDGRDMRSVATDVAKAPPTWLNDTTVAYLTNARTGSSGYLIKRATDMPNGGATATVIHDCSGTSPPFRQIGQFEIVGSTVLLTAQADMAAPITIHRNTLGTCSAVPFVTTEAGATALDFSISPDGRTMIYASSTGYLPLDLGDTFANQLTDIWAVPVDGSSPPRKIGGDPNLIDFGARFIANGRQIVWTQFANFRETDMGGGSVEPTSTSLWIANADGSKPRRLFGPATAPAAGSYRLVVGGAHSGLLNCAMGDGEVTVMGAALLLALVVALGARRAVRGSRSR